MNKTSSSRPGTWRPYRPLLWWLLLFLGLLALRTHERLSEKTRITFSVELNGQSALGEAFAVLDGKPVNNGDHLNIGNHTFQVSHPKGDSFTTNFFAWYGGFQLGKISLPRSRGKLIISASPAASVMRVEGPEFTRTFTNTSKETLDVPTDRYRLSARFRYWNDATDATVSGRSPEVVSFTPRFGALALACNRRDATFELHDERGRIVERGNFHGVIDELPEGRYTLFTRYHGKERRQNVAVASNRTNQVQIDLIYGAIVIETEPPGATVLDRGDSEVGKTPLFLPEIEIGTWAFTLRLAGYEAMQTSAAIKDGETNLFRKKLVNSTYLGAIANAHRYINSKEYRQAYEAASEALRLEPKDGTAKALKVESLGNENLRLAKELGSESKYNEAILTIKAALDLLPGNEEATQLLSNYEKSLGELLKKKRVDRERNAERAFKVMFGKYKDSALFETREIKAKGSQETIGNSIFAVFHGRKGYLASKLFSEEPETFAIEVNFDIINNLGGTIGLAQCVLVGAQKTDNEVEIAFKILEYKAEPAIKFSIGALIPMSNTVNYFVIPPGRSDQPDKLHTMLKNAAASIIRDIEGITESKSAKIEKT
jgi:tetratricopeptide (TPR) repeat protein